MMLATRYENGLRQLSGQMLLVNVVVWNGQAQKKGVTDGDN
jgi:hypothetical protein